MQTLYFLILVPMVYLAVAVFVIGIVVRLIGIFRAPKHPTTLQIFPDNRTGWLWTLRDSFLMPTIFRHKPVFWLFLMAFHICLVLLLVGHIELLGEIDWFQFIPHDIFIGQGFVGLITVVCLLYFMQRRFKSPVRELSVPEDYYLLILLLLVVIFGSEMDWARRWYEYGEMAPSDYQAYLGSLIRFQPEVPYEVSASGHSFMLVLHVFLANVFLIFFPFSQSMHAILSLPLNKLRRG